MNYHRLSFYPVFQSTYSSKLNTNSTTYYNERCGTSQYYYEALQFKVSVSSAYGFANESNMHIYGSLYEDAFDPANRSRNLIANNHTDCNNRRFWLYSVLRTDITYILVITTNSTNVTGAFSVVSSGLATFEFTRLGKYHYYLVLHTKVMRSRSSSHSLTNETKTCFSITWSQNQYSQRTSFGNVLSGYLRLLVVRCSHQSMRDKRLRFLYCVSFRL